MVRCNNNRGSWHNGGGWCLGKLKNSRFLSQTHIGHVFVWTVMSLIHLGESGATCHRGKLSHSHCKSNSLIDMDFSNIYLKEIHQSVSKTSSTKFLLLCACIQFMTVTTYPCYK